MGIALFLVIAGLLILVNGMITGSLIWIIVGFVMVFFPVFLKNIGQSEKQEKTVFDLNVNKDKVVLNLPKTVVRKKDIKLSLILTLLVAMVAFALSWNFLIGYLFAPTPLSFESAVSGGCAELDPRSGCSKDPNSIIVRYDVNSNGIIGDANDTLKSLLAKYNCTDTCLYRRCGCPGY